MNKKRISDVNIIMKKCVFDSCVNKSLFLAEMNKYIYPDISNIIAEYCKEYNTDCLALRNKRKAYKLNKRINRSHILIIGLKNSRFARSFLLEDKHKKTIRDNINHIACRDIRNIDLDILMTGDMYFNLRSIALRMNCIKKTVSISKSVGYNIWIVQDG